GPAANARAWETPLTAADRTVTVAVVGAARPPTDTTAAAPSSCPARRTVKLLKNPRFYLFLSIGVVLAALVGWGGYHFFGPEPGPGPNQPNKQPQVQGPNKPDEKTVQAIRQLGPEQLAVLLAVHQQLADIDDWKTTQFKESSWKKV